MGLVSSDSTSPMSTWKTPYVGHFVSWDDGCLLIGRGGSVVPVHAHYAIQIAFGSIPGIRFRGSESEEWTEYPGAVIPSRQPHSMDVRHVQPNLVLFVEPETRQGRAINERWLGDGIASVPWDVIGAPGGAIFDAWQEERSHAAMERAAKQLVHVLAGGVDPMVVSDERILRAIAHIRAHLDQPLTLEEVADVACLSPSRFRHLFVEETGTAFRPYVLWRRFLKVWELLSQGGSLSTAAHGAGFADAAHLSRTSKQMFGFPPSLMDVSRPLGEDDARGSATRRAEH
jgi:AraC family transcriptional regulator